MEPGSINTRNSEECWSPRKRARKEAWRTHLKKQNKENQRPSKVIKRTAEDLLDSGCLKKPRFEEIHVQKIKQHLAGIRLDERKETTVTVDNIKSLSEHLTVEKIIDIKVKHLAKKRKTIKADIGMGAKLRVIHDIDYTKDIVSRERPGRTRITILQSRGKLFAKDIFAILQSVEDRQKKPMAPTSMMTRRSALIKPLPQPAVYNRYYQEKFIRQKQKSEGFIIDTLGTFQDMTLKGTNPALSISAAKITSQETAQNKRPNRTPIIIIPAANTSLITMYNAKDILQDMKFISNEEKKAQASKKENEILLHRRKRKDGGFSVPYRIVDNPQKLTNSDWERVVAVFVMGPAWQFKGWPFGGNPVEIFSKICAFHLKYDEMTLNANIARWDVSVIELSKNKRHLDRAALMKFWDVLDKFQATHKK